MGSPDRNIVMVTADSIRADHCGFLDEGRDTTPVLDRMATEGIVYEDAIAPGPRTPSSMPEIVTGAEMPKTVADDWDWQVRTARIRKHLANHDTLAQKLQELGYTTVGFTANPWTTDFDAGFDRFTVVEHDSAQALKDRFFGTALQPVIWASHWIHKDSWFCQWSRFYDDVRQAMASVPEPYFLWIFLMDTHTPYIVPRQDRTENSTLGMYEAVLRSSSVFGTQDGQSYYRESLPERVETRVKRAYQDAIRSVDRFVGVLRDDLSADDPVFVFHSDHGEAFDEHGTYGHQRALYEENVRVPLLVADGGEAVRVSDQVSLRALPEMVTAHARDGRPDPTSWTTEYAVSRTEDSEVMAARDGRWKYISSPDATELYDLRTDPHERRNRIDEEPGRAVELSDVLDAFERDLPIDRWDGDRATASDPDVRDRLESLGYLE